MTLSRTSTTLLRGLVDPRNDRAWRRFYARYTPMLRSYARRVGLNDADAQDAVAETLETFARAYGAGRYDRTRGRLKSWLGGIILRKVMKLRAVRRGGASLTAVDSHVRGAAALGDVPAAEVDLAAAFDREWELQQMDEALVVLRREVDPTTYQAFDLYALKDWPASQVAAFLGVTPNVVYISKTRVLQRLRELVAARGDDEG